VTSALARLRPHLAEGDPAEGGQLVGRDPRAVAPEAWATAGVVPSSPIRAIRAKCLDCCAGQAAEVRRCMALACALWPVRMGVNVFHASRAAGPENPPNGAVFEAAGGDPTEVAGEASPAPGPA
jgi:hypothetical protein